MRFSRNIASVQLTVAQADHHNRIPVLALQINWHLTVRLTDGFDHNPQREQGLSLIHI